MLCVVLVATKLYQTSSSAVPLQPAWDCVADTVDPVVETAHDVVGFTVSPMAEPQLSLASGTGVVIQTVKVPWSPTSP